MEQNVKWEQDAQTGKWICPYADHVTCRDRLCPCCGWYPPEIERRQQQYQKYGVIIPRNPENISPDWDDQRETGLLSFD